MATRSETACEKGTAKIAKHAKEEHGIPSARR